LSDLHFTFTLIISTMNKNKVQKSRAENKRATVH